MCASRENMPCLTYAYSHVREVFVPMRICGMAVPMHVRGMAVRMHICGMASHEKMRDMRI